MEDEEIVALYWQRSEDAIRETAKKYEAYLTKIARNILFDAEDCGECVNDTYLAAWNSMPEHRPGVLSMYLGKITRQISIDRFRKRNSAKRRGSEYALSLTELEDTFADDATPERALDAKLLDAAIGEFVRSLPEEARRVFIGRYYFFDPLKTVAGYCGISEAKAKSILYRTRLKLKEHLEKEGFIL